MNREVKDGANVDVNWVGYSTRPMGTSSVDHFWFGQNEAVNNVDSSDTASKVPLTRQFRWQGQPSSSEL